MGTAAATQTKLDKAQARVEDLEEQLKQKVEQEQRMSAEKYQLESRMTQSTKQMERMSMNVEELQWRIRNNFELPVDIYSKPAPASGTGHLQNVDKMPDNNVPCSKIIDGHQVSNKFVIPVCHQGGQQKIEADADENDESDVIDETVGDAANDISPSSDICMDYDSIENRQEQDEKGDGNNNIPTVEEEEDENVDHDTHFWMKDWVTSPVMGKWQSHLNSKILFMIILTTLPVMKINQVPISMQLMKLVKRNGDLRESRLKHLCKFFYVSINFIPSAIRSKINSSKFVIKIAFNDIIKI